MGKNKFKQFTSKFMPQITEAEALHKTGLNEQAYKICQDILLEEPNNALVFNLLGQIYQDKKDFDKSITNYNKAISLYPHVYLFYYNLAFAKINSGDFISAIPDLEKVIELAPGFVDAYITLSKIQLNLRNFDEALEIINKTYINNRDNPEVLLQMAIINEYLQNNKKAKELYEKVLAKKPYNTIALTNLGKLFFLLGENNLAINHLKQALDITPNDPNVLNNLGNIYYALDECGLAIEYFAKALQKNINLLPAKVNLGAALNYSGKISQSVIVFEEILNTKNNTFQPTVADNDYFYQKAVVGLALAYQHSCSWHALDKLKPGLIQILNKNVANEDDTVITPFEAVMLDLDPMLIKAITKKVEAKLLEKAVELNKTHGNFEAKSNDRIKIAYISPNFWDHAIGILVQNLFKYHDRSEYEVYLIKTSNINDQMTKNIIHDIEHVVDLGDNSINESVKILRDLNLDVAIDLDGHTRGSKLEVFAARIAKLQMHWLGYINTIGSNIIDYIIADKTQVTQDLRAQFLEDVAYVKDTIIGCNKFKISTNVIRSDYDLPAESIVFCCFNKHYRIDEEVFKLWMEILSQVENSVLWLNCGDDSIEQNLVNYAKVFGLQDRLIFCEPHALSHNWRHQLADIWLDTLTLSAGTASILSAAVGLPFITYYGNTVQSRSSARIAKAAGIEECIVYSKEDYVSLAVELGNNRDKLHKLKNKMLANIGRTPLFEPEEFIKNFENMIKEKLHLKQSSKHSEQALLS